VTTLYFTGTISKNDLSNYAQKARYGRTFATGLYPSWSSTNPVHFIAHSLGGTTITVLQTLIASGHFKEVRDASNDMISSLNTVAAPFKGTPFSYMLGKSYENSVDTRFWSVSFLLVVFVIYPTYTREEETNTD